VLVDSGVVHDVREPAECVHCGLDQPRRSVCIRHIRTDDDGRLSAVADALGDGVGGLLVRVVVDGDVVPVVGEAACDPAADPSRRARHERGWHICRLGPPKTSVYRPR